MSEQLVSLACVAALLLHEVHKFFFREVSVLTSEVLEQVDCFLDGLVGQVAV